LVLVDNIVENIPTHSVTINNYSGAKNAVRYLIENNHKNIHYLSGDDTIYVNHKRNQGYVDAMTEAGLPCHVHPSGILLNDGYETMKTLLLNREISLPAAIFCLSDETAIGAMRAIKEAGLSVPDDISVVGFDNIEVTEFTDPPLTTVSQPRFEMGKTAAEIILSCLDNNENGERHQNIVFIPKLITRKSVRTLS
jgi:LacI family transcriptional regulator